MQKKSIFYLITLSIVDQVFLDVLTEWIFFSFWTFQIEKYLWNFSCNFLIINYLKHKIVRNFILSVHISYNLSSFNVLKNVKIVLEIY